MQHSESFRDLIVYQKARKVAQGFFDLSLVFPKEERYSLTDQGRRSSRSIGTQIAEAWAKVDKADLFCGTSVRGVREDTVEYFMHRSPITDHQSLEQ